MEAKRAKPICLATNARAYYQMSSLDFDFRVMSHLCVRIIMTVCIKVDQLFALNSLQWFLLVNMM